MPLVTKAIKDANGDNFSLQLWDPETGEGLISIHQIVGVPCDIVTVDVTNVATSISALLTAAGGAAITHRTAIEIYNLGDEEIYVGDDNTVTHRQGANPGRPIKPDDSWSIPLNETDKYLITTLGPVKVVITQI